MSFVEITEGNSPVILGFPHTGTDLPETALARLNETGRALADTDWHIHRLYGGLLDGVSTVRTTVHRYVIDVNRDPAGVSLYPGQNTTGLCPITNFEGQSIYLNCQQPDDATIDQRRRAFHQPYHAALQAAQDRVQAIHGFSILLDCHSIRSQIPFLFKGTLPDFNIGTNGGQTCDAAIETTMLAVTAGAAGYTHVLNGRFKGGWTTRHYGRPASGQHAIQLELAQSTYMQPSPPWDSIPDKADRLRTHLRSILTAFSNYGARRD